MVAFGRRPEFDIRSLAYPVHTLLEPVQPVTKFWNCGQVLDQGSEGACVGFSWSHELICEPVVVGGITNETARAVYRRAQQLDQWDGEDYEGTSVIAGAKAIMEQGHLLEYRWAFGLADVLEALSQLGPVVLGVNWYEGMLDTDDGYLEVTGQIVGGHAILCRGIDTTEKSVLLHNSWGSSWGINGYAKLAWGDLERLLHEGGEACVPLVRVYEPPLDERTGCLPKWILRGFNK